MIDRDELEQLALDIISPELYYDLLDTLDSVTDSQLWNIIGCAGDYLEEMRVYA